MEDKFGMHQHRLWRVRVKICKKVQLAQKKKSGIFYKPFLQIVSQVGYP